MTYIGRNPLHRAAENMLCSIFAIIIYLLLLLFLALTTSLNKPTAAEKENTKNHFVQKATFNTLNCFRGKTKDSVVYMVKAPSEKALTPKNVETCIEISQKNSFSIMDEREGLVTALRSAQIKDFQCFQTNEFTLMFEGSVPGNLDILIPVCFEAAREGYEKVKNKKTWFMKWV